jgi:hypothetical protein
MLNGNQSGFLIGISGKIGSGKDTFAGLLAMAIYEEKKLTNVHPLFTKEELEDKGWSERALKHEDIEIHKFADALKDIACILTGCTREQLEDQDFKNSEMPSQWNQVYSGISIPYTYRQFLQELGTNVLRNWIPNIHINATFSKWKPIPVREGREHYAGHAITTGSIEERMPKWIITDMRFPNEVEVVKQRGGIVIRIWRGKDENLGMGVPPIHEHPSETALDDYQDWDAVIDNNGSIEDLYNQAIKIVKQFKLHEQ